MPQQQADVEQHADGDEEQTQQYFAVGTDRRLDLMSKLGFREHHPGQKSAERERQAYRVSSPGRGQDREQYGQRKQLRGSHRGNDEEQRPQQPSSGGEYQQQGEYGDTDGAGDMYRVRGLSATGQ